MHAEIAPGAEVLDLGYGSGRIAHRLIELGHPVTAVDDSPEMLAYVRGAERSAPASRIYGWTGASAACCWPAI
ncbi:class I SAM-dependent methyltransferase [Amycolatopsis sp.]|uniref:class I SAM-dependent methyltransferase n=1 Tax=Amycolatopsis sp. TaxID=37632 RepID=UPI002B8509D8|nr:class I SAM-dependent methyltransferase [Amycolatopsis sp.]HVV13973.1 class I SAM-dependent methyltransferase [Amycolatopsis sp.]